MTLSRTPITRSTELDLDRHQEAGLNAVRALTEQLNSAIARAVEMGVTIEVTRSSRHHTAQCSWGDQIALAVNPQTAEQ
jgi:hypothetical protein